MAQHRALPGRWGARGHPPACELDGRAGDCRCCTRRGRPLLPGPSAHHVMVSGGSGTAPLAIWFGGSQAEPALQLVDALFSGHASAGRGSGAGVAVSTVCTLFRQVVLQPLLVVQHSEHRRPCAHFVRHPGRAERREPPPPPPPAPAARRRHRPLAAA